jgi:glucose-6-phosphate 1-dehydrogenase
VIVSIVRDRAIRLPVRRYVGIENWRWAGVPFYEETGALRDMVVTHLLQVLGFVAMEPPTSFSAKALLDETVKVVSRHGAAAPRGPGARPVCRVPR